MSDFLRGFALPFHALRLIGAHATLRRWSAAIAALTAVLLVALVGVLVLYTGDLLGLVWSKPSGELRFLWYAVAALLFTLLFVVGASTVPTVATAPLSDPLSEATERILGVVPPGGGGVSRLARETANAVRKAALRVGILLAGHGLLLLLWILPGVGHALWSVLSLGWTIFWLAFEYIDIPANRYAWRFREVARTILANPAPCLGFGTAVYLILWVPLLNFVFIPVATVGATVLFTELRRKGHLARQKT